PAEEGTTRSRTAGGETRSDPPRYFRPDRPAADAGRSGSVRQGFLPRRLREGGRSPAVVPALRRAGRAALARSRALRRQRRFPPGRLPAARLALPRLRDPVVQRG